MAAMIKGHPSTFKTEAELDPMLAPGFFTAMDNAAERKAFFKKWVRKVILESSSYCNRACSYCPQQLRKTKTLMADELFENVLEQLVDLDYDREVILQLFNEPLAFPEQILSRVRRLRQRLPGCFIYFSTNGDFLKPDLLRELVDAGLSALTISVHPGKSYRETALLNRFFSLARRLDLKLTFTQFDPGLAIAAETSFGDVPIRIRATDFTKRGSNRGGLMKNVEAPEHRELACALPFEIFSVGFDGTYFPCYHMIAGVPEHAHLAIDKLDANSSITEAFNHPRIRQWRREVFTQGPKHEPCTSCHLDFIKLTPEQNDGREALLRSLDDAPPAQAQGAEEVRP